MLATRMTASAAGADFYPYRINYSCRFDDNVSAYLQRTNPASRTDGSKITISFWVKRCNMTTSMHIFDGGSGTADASAVRFSSADTLTIKHEDGGVANFNLTSSAVFRDVTSWYHILVKYDSDEAAGADRILVWINNVEITDWNTEDNPSSGKNQDWTRVSQVARIGRGRLDDSSRYGDFYLAEFHVIDGQALTPDYFGESKNGIWIPKRYTGTYGLQGFYLDFADSSDLGKDVSGNGGDFTANNLTVDDQTLDSPTNNWCNWNILTHIITGTSILREGNLRFTCDTPSYAGVLGTFMLPKTGKWYWEFLQGAADCRTEYGICTEEAFSDSPYAPLNESEGWGVRLNTGGTSQYRNNGSNLGNIGFTFASGEVLQVAYDADTGKMWSGSDDDDWDGDPEAGTGNTITVPDLTLDYFPFTANWSSADNSGMTADFGQIGFAHTPPTGFKALCSNNLPLPSIKDSSKGFDVLTYLGDDITPKSRSGLSFQPDLVWTKDRDGITNHGLVDSVRGTGAKVLNSDITAVELGEGGNIDSFDSGGFTVSDGSINYSWFNTNAHNYVAWCFRMGAKYGFDIIPYLGTGAAHAINHNLGGVPEMFIVKKNAITTGNWIVYHYHASNKTDPETDYGILNLANAWADINTVWNDTAPTSTQFTVGTDTDVNADGSNHIAYLWRSIPGFSKVFGYTGNGDADGPFVYCGFRPRFIFIKDASGAYKWRIVDTARDTYNSTANKILWPDVPDSEGSGGPADILSNGFKLRTLSNGWNNLDNLHVGIAIAEAPDKWSNAR